MTHAFFKMWSFKDSQFALTQFYVRFWMVGLVLLMVWEGPVFSQELRFNHYFDNGMVLQRNTPLTIKGFASKEKMVTVRFAGQSVSTKADDRGRWEVTLQPLKAKGKGEPLSLVSDGKEIALQDVVVGDVFLFARQSSIDLSIKSRRGDQFKFEELGEKKFRSVTIETLPASEPQIDLSTQSTNGWGTITEKRALSMDAAAYEMASALAKELNHPVGLVELKMGAYFPIAWMSREDLLKTAELFGEEKTPVEKQVESFTLKLNKYESGALKESFMEPYSKDVQLALARKQTPPSTPVMPHHPLKDPRFPAAGYNGVLHPLRGISFKAVVLQIGNDYPYVFYEKMAREGELLQRGKLGMAWKETYDLKKWCIYMEPYTLPRLVKQWRVYFDDMNLPFGLITPPSSDLGTLARHHMEIRELQRRMSEENPKVGLIIPKMEHIPFSAQAKDQAAIGDRALAWVRGAVLGKEGVAPTGPNLEKIETDYTRAKVIYQSGTAKGLQASAGALEQFEAAGTDGIYYPAKASIVGEEIHLHCERVNQIVHVRYNWNPQPDMGLKNDSGLPAIPFRTDDHPFPITIKYTEFDLPLEYTTPAKDWKDGDVTIVNGSLRGGNWPDGEGCLGVTGITVAPFGPNVSVLQVLKGSPADGKILVGDVIYDVNGTLFGEQPLKDVAQALAYGESEAGGGKISFGLRRGGKNLDVELEIEILGSYSSTSPFDCPKTDKIVTNMEKFLAERGGAMKSHPVFSNLDALFLLAAGTPEYQGLVRRKVYERMNAFDYEARIDPLKPKPEHPQNWHFAYNALLVSEYFLATGDRNVLPFLKWNLDYLAITQNKVESGETPWPSAYIGAVGGWRHNFYGQPGYGMLPTIGGPAVLSFRYALDIGLDVDRKAYERGLQYFEHNGVKIGKIIYGSYPTPQTTPEPIDYEAVKNGKLPNSNGMHGLAAILYDRIGDERTAHLCSFYAANSFNNLAKAHGGNFWGNWMGGAGAYVQSKSAFIRFMKEHAWYRDLHRMFDHSFLQGNGGYGGGQALSLVLPRHRLQMLGASESIFQKNPKDVFRPALDAHYRKDYALAHRLAKEVLETQILNPTDKAKAKQLMDLTRDLQRSILADLAKVESLLEEKRYYEASLDLSQLIGVVPETEPRLKAIEAILSNPDIEGSLREGSRAYRDQLGMKKLVFREPEGPKKNVSEWICLTPQTRLAHKMSGGSVADGEANQWKLKVVESASQAPQGWASPGYNDQDWLQTPLPISWHLNHQALLRTEFHVEDVDSIDSLRIRSWTFRQQNVKVYLNGVLVAKVNKASNNPTLTSVLTQESLKSLKNGKNILAVTTLNNWRWGRFIRKYESDKYNSVYNNGYSFLLDMRVKN